jgi:GH24 family phage-related lysozyme (muramidase)
MTRSLRSRSSLRHWETAGAGLALGLATALAGTPPGAESAAGTERAALARAAFDRFRALEGSWEGRSTKGWVEDVSFRTIAGGSAVVETSFDAHPGETMLTVVHMDGAELTLTHYCVAKNQPHMRATAFSDGGRTVTFEFAGGGNLADRNRGHMDGAVFRFEDADHVVARWSWYENGSERWMEEIRMVRKR